MDFSLELPYVNEEIGRSGFIDIKNNTDKDELYSITYKLAKYFKEELNYDTVPFESSGILADPYHVVLFTEKDYDKSASGEENCYRIYGACLFSERDFKIEGTIKKLEWIWLHPFYRNRGNLSSIWKHHLQERFGDFLIGSPVSPAMNVFFKKIRDDDFKHIVI